MNPRPTLLPVRPVLCNATTSIKRRLQNRHHPPYAACSDMLSETCDDALHHMTLGMLVVCRGHCFSATCVGFRLTQHDSA